MPRANRYFLPGYVWHITHRCHKKDFLLKFARDRSAWIGWLFEARKSYEIEVLNYTVTSNHVHLLVYGGTNREVIPRSLQLVAGRTAQEYNQRKNRKGAFWEDRYHATAVDTDRHLVRCLIYIDLNMVRAGVVSHPVKWIHSGFHEIINPPKRYRVLARDRLKMLLNIDEKNLVTRYPRWVEENLRFGTVREAFWSEAVAAGTDKFLENIRQQLGIKGKHRRIQAQGEDASGTFSLQEPASAYEGNFNCKKCNLSSENGLFWEIFPDI